MSTTAKQRYAPRPAVVRRRIGVWFMRRGLRQVGWWFYVTRCEHCLHFSNAMHSYSRICPRCGVDGDTYERR